jgi:hypothetical protein
MRRFSKIRSVAGVGQYLSYSLYERPARLLPAVLLPLFTELPRVGLLENQFLAPTTSLPPRVGARTPLKMIQNDNALKARFSATLDQVPGVELALI